MDNLFRDMSADLLRRGYGVRFRATGYSMQPTIEDGEVITVAPVAPAAVTHGDNNQHNTPTDAAGNTWIQAIEWANMQSSTGANGGFSQASGQPFVHTGVDGNTLCITQVGANRVSGSLSYIVEAD